MKRLSQLAESVKTWFMGKCGCGEDVVARIKEYPLRKDIPGVDVCRRGSFCKKLVCRIEKLLHGSQEEKEKRKELCRKISRNLVLAAGVCCFLLVFHYVAGGFQLYKNMIRNVELFYIQEIEITGQASLTKNEIRNVAGINYNDSTLLLDIEAVRKKIENLEWVREAEVKIDWPASVSIHVREHRAEAIVFLEKDGVSVPYFLSRNGLVCIPVQGDEELDYPVITGVKNREDILQKKEVMQEIFAFIKRSKGNQFLPTQSISEFHVNNEDQVVLFLVEQSFPVFLGEGDMSKKYRRLVAVLEVLYRKGGNKVKIDNVGSIRMEYYDDKVLVSSN